MNGKDIFKGLRYIDDDIIEEAEFGMFPAKTVHRTIQRPLLVAAIIAMMLLLVGCAVVYMLSLKEIKLGEEQSTYDAFSYDPDFGASDGDLQDPSARYVGVSANIKF